MYKALYRKWRPATFDTVCGQEHITTVLKNQVITGTVSHAYLFCGTHGTGKTTCAKVLAKAVNCLSPVNGSPCGKCAACLSIDSGAATDVLEIDAASNNGVDSIRAIRDEVVYPPSALKKRVYIIDEVHMLTDSANNALLKTLEEPPEYVLFVLATTELQKIPATILSRCQRFEFRRIDSDVISDRVREVCGHEGISIDDEAVNLISRLANGAMRDALSLLESCAAASESGKIEYSSAEKQLGISNNEQVVSLLECAARGDTAGAMEILDELYKSSRDLAALVDQLVYLTRDLTVLQSLPGIGLNRLGSSFCFSNAMFEELQRLAKTITKEQLLYYFEVLSDARAKFGGAALNKRLVAEMAVIKLSQPEFAGGLDALQARVSALEAGVPVKAVPVAKPAVTQSAPKEDVPKQASRQKFTKRAELLDALSKRGAGAIYAFASTSAYELQGEQLHIYPDSGVGYSVLSTDSAIGFLCEAATAALKKQTEIVVHKYEELKNEQPSLIDELM